jgi:SNF2 family DNA or RNA helicase
MRDVEFSPEQKRLYQEFKRNLVMDVAGGKQVVAVNEAALRLKLIQISCGAIYDSDHKAHLIDARPRIEETLEVIEQSSAKCIVFAPFTSVVHMLSQELGKHHSVATITGATPVKERNETFRRFQDEETPKVIVADPGTMSHGLDLFAAATVIWYAPTDKTETYLQANKRIDRPGQTMPTTIVQLASNGAEREIFRRLENNESLQGVLLKLVRGEMD